MRRLFGMLSAMGVLTGVLCGCSKGANESTQGQAGDESTSMATEQQNLLGGMSADFGFSAQKFTFPKEGGSVVVTAKCAWEIAPLGWVVLYKTYGTTHAINYLCEVPEDTVVYAVCRDMKDKETLYQRANIGELPVKGMSMAEFMKAYPQAQTLAVTLWRNPLKIQSLSCEVKDPLIYSANNPLKGFVTKMQVDEWFTLERKLLDWYEILGVVADSRLGADLKPVATYLQYRIREEGDFRAVLTVAPNTTGKPRTLTVPVGKVTEANTAFVIEQQ